MNKVGEMMQDVTSHPTESALVGYLDQREDELVQLAMDLMGMPTPNPPGDNYKAFCDFLAAWLAKAGLEVEVVTPPPEVLSELLQSEAEGQRYAVLGRLTPAAQHPALCLQGHYDTVPPSGDWEFDPYTPRLANGNLYGLGATDMKGGLASMMMAAKALSQSEVDLRGSLYFLATPDEEFSSGAGLAYFLERDIVRPDYAIVGEPSGAGNIYVGMKGGIWGDLIVHGQAAHGSQPFAGINAFEKMVEVAGAVRTTLIPRLAQRVSRYDFYPPQGDQPTLTLGGMVGGTNASRAMVPDRCTVSFDRRLIPEESLEEAEAELISFFKDLQRQNDSLLLEVRISFRAAPMVTPVDAEICQVMSDTITQLAHASPTHTVSCGGFETALFFKRGVQAITYGPGVEGCAHAADEHTLVADLVFTAKVYALTALRLLG